MSKSLVSVVRYEKPGESVRKAVELAKGLDHLPNKASVYIKPNIVAWYAAGPFPKWGVITTSRVIEDVVILLKERGIDDITIGEGMSSEHAYTTLGYYELNKKYGVKVKNGFDSEMEEVDLGDGIALNFSANFIHSDFVITIPAMKCHNQTVVSLGIKNLKGMIDANSRKICHNADPNRDLHFHIARLADKMPPMLNVIDGIYTLEKGPSYDGRMKRSNVLVASSDVLSADMVGAKILGYNPSDVPHLVHAAKNRNRPWDLSDIEVMGEKIENVASFHKFDFEYIEDENGCMPEALHRSGVKGLYYRKFDSTMCTSCSGMNGNFLNRFRSLYNPETPYDRVEVLSGKIMEPTPGMNYTVLFGKCQVDKNENHPDIKEAILIKGCPPQMQLMSKGLAKMGINMPEGAMGAGRPSRRDQAAGPPPGGGIPHPYMSRYEGNPEFEESFFRVT